MELPEHIYYWLKDVGTISSSEPTGPPFEISEQEAQSLETGHPFSNLVKRLNQIKVTFKQNNLERLRTPIPEVNTLKDASAPSGKLYNWNVISQALETLGVTLDPDTKSLIVAGDREMLLEVLQQIHTAEQTKPQKRNKTPGGGGVFLDNIETSKPLFEAESCLEFLILSFCHNFKLTVKQGAGLLAQGNKYLAHIVAKGLKGDFEPVIVWLQDIYSNTETLTQLILNESKEGALDFTLSGLKPGLISKDLEAVQWCLRVFSKLVLEFSENGLLEECWKWFNSESNILSMCVYAIQRFGREIYSNVIELFLQIGQQDYVEFFTSHLKKAVNDNKLYLNLLCDFFPYLAESESSYEEVSNSGVIGYWLELGLSEAENISSKDASVRVAGMAFLTQLVLHFHSKVLENEFIINSILSLLNRLSREGNFILKYLAIGNLFYLLEFLAEHKSQFAATIYRALTFLLVENYSSTDLRNYIQSNFILTFESLPSMPVSILVDPLIKRLQVEELGLNTFDFDFIVAIAQHGSTTLKQGIHLIDILGKIYLNNMVDARAAGVGFTFLASRFIDEEAMQEYLYIFCRYCLNIIVSAEQELETPNKELEYQRNLIVDMVCWIVQQWQDQLEEKLKDLLLQSNFGYKQVTGSDCKSLLEILSLYGNLEEVLEEFDQKSKELFTAQEESNEEDMQLVPIKENPVPKKKKTAFPWARANADIERVKQRHKEKELKKKEEEEKKAKVFAAKQKRVQKQLEIRRLEQGKEGSSVLQEGQASKLITAEEFVVKEFSQEDQEELEAVKLVLSKYSRVFKVFFQKYSGTGFSMKKGGKSDFDWLAERKNKINEAEFIKLMREHGVIPKLLSKEDLKTVMKSYCHKVLKQTELTTVDYEGFKGVFCQLAWFVYSKPPNDFSHMPAVVSVKQLIMYMRDNLKQRKLSTEIFDEPDPGVGDKDVVKKLNKLLASDPETQLPEGYKRVTDKDIEVAFKIPEFLEVKESFKTSFELLDEVFNSALGFHLIEPFVEYRTTYRAKGIPPKKEKLELPPIQDRPASLLKRKREERSPPPVQSPKKSKKLSPTLKFQIVNASKEDKEYYEEAASALEDILHSLSLKMTRLINRGPRPSEEKFQEKQQRQKAEQEQRKRAEEKRRRLRQQIIQEQLAKAKEERQAKLAQEAEKKKRETELQNAKKKAMAEKARKEKEEKEREIKDWVERKREEEKKQKEEELSKQNKAIEKKKQKMEEAKKRNQERLQQLLKEQDSKAKQLKQEETKTHEPKPKATYSKALEKAKQEQVKTQKAKEEVKELSRTTQELFSTYNQQIQAVFVHYCKQFPIKIEQDASSMLSKMSFSAYNKFAKQLNIFPELITTEENQKIFKTLTKEKTTSAGVPKTIDFREFKQALEHIASSGRGRLNEFKNMPEQVLNETTIQSLFEWIEVNRPLKEVQAMLKEKMEQGSSKPSRVVSKKPIGTNESISHSSSRPQESMLEP